VFCWAAVDSNSNRNSSRQQASREQPQKLSKEVPTDRVEAAAPLQSAAQCGLRNTHHQAEATSTKAIMCVTACRFLQDKPVHMHLQTPAQPTLRKRSSLWSLRTKPPQRTMPQCGLALRIVCKPVAASSSTWPCQQCCCCCHVGGAEQWG
jgi:hypothetical protein